MLWLSVGIILSAVSLGYAGYEKPGLVMKAYNYQIVSKSGERVLRGGRGGGRSRGRSSSSSYGGRYSSGSRYISPAYGSATYIPVAYQFVYTLGYYQNRPS